ncbi:sulfur carrier protein ThiS [Cryptosporangium arvum]|uniref:Thiamine biosynthesis protein ThiS n=1 Tax=Cryptosporangium arvum DSM 44712 TaxID=927661 RepID=A0A010YIN3_9ACTN|nr:sulfur carrier protein ThiS [Cryptosporangium arvum]EXG80115.1 thiamine biosynthesis protein ThiS [Cryptosporangium arvum DSM 44712]
MTTLRVNGREVEVSDPTTVAVLVRQLTPSPRGVAVAVNGAVVPRGGWAGAQLTDGDEVEVLMAVQGG